MKTAVVTGMIASYPVGGVGWDYGQYALGLERLGFDVYYLEDTGCQTFNPVQGAWNDDASYGIAFLEGVLAQLSSSLARRWHVRLSDGATFGVDRRDMLKRIVEADLFLNVSGAALLRDEYLPSRRKVLIDTDPGWNHFRNYPRWDNGLRFQGSHGYRAHDFFFTYAERIGCPSCRLPLLGLPWQPTRPPVVLDCWDATPAGDRWTTVMTWKTYHPEQIVHDGEAFGAKELEFRHIEELPKRADAAFEVAVGGAYPPRERWRSIGWSVIDAFSISRTIDDYRAYVQHSRGELSVAKNVYVPTGSGWFSCRSVCYLAAGRPVVLQDTGFSDVIPTGNGLLAFSTLAEAIDSIERVEAEYGRHQRAACEVARACFDSDRVLADMLARVGLD